MQQLERSLMSRVRKTARTVLKGPPRHLACESIECQVGSLLWVGVTVPQMKGPLETYQRLAKAL